MKSKIKATRILSFFIYCAFTAILSFAEKKFGIVGVAAGFCFALVFCRENILVAVAQFALANALVHFSLWYVIYVAAVVVVLLALSFAYFKLNKKYRLWVFALVFLVSQTATFGLYNGTEKELVKDGVGLVIGLAFFYTSVVFLYPCLVRKMRSGLTSGEMACGLILTVFAGIGLDSFDICGVKLLYFVCVVLALIFAVASSNKILPVAVSLGVGGGIAGGGYYSAFLCGAIGLTVYFFSDKNKFLRGIFTAAVVVLIGYIHNAGFNLYETLPPCAGALFVLLPEKIFDSWKNVDKSAKGRFALRTMLNRDREELAAKLDDVAFAFRKMEGILSVEEKSSVKADVLVSRVTSAYCNNCVRHAECRKQIGDISSVLTNLAVFAVNNGKISMLDAEPLGKVCIKLPKIVGVINEFASAYRKLRERQSGLAQGKSMVVSNLDCTAELLEELARNVGSGFGFDVESEKRITEQLGYANVVASDVAISGGGAKVTLSLREEDSNKKQVAVIISDVLGAKMREVKKEAPINGVVNVMYKPTPVYGALYGERSLAKGEVSGDARQAVRIADDKVIFILSDGMGTGAEANKTGSDSLGLIESFYQAGFNHKTIFSIVAKLLALRESETFSAIDIAVLDTQTAEIDFIKQGGRESYVFTDGGAEAIKSDTLPLGILAESDPKVERRVLTSGNLVVMISDGVADVLTPSDIAETVSSVRSRNPQEIADKIVANTLSKSGGKENQKDDITCMCFRITKN